MYRVPLLNIMLSLWAALTLGGNWIECKWDSQVGSEFPSWQLEYLYPAKVEAGTRRSGTEWAAGEVEGYEVRRPCQADRWEYSGFTRGCPCTHTDRYIHKPIASCCTFCKAPVQQPQQRLLKQMCTAILKTPSVSLSLHLQISVFVLCFHYCF